MPTAVVTGAASMLGEGICNVLEASGWSVIATDIKAREQKSGQGDSRRLLELDVRDHLATRSFFENVASTHGTIDALVNAAGGMRGLGIPRAPFQETQPDGWEAILSANLLGVLNCTHAVLPMMTKSGNGAIVSVAAGRGLRGGPDAAVYSAAKAAVIVFSQSVAQEVAQFGVRVNTLAPGNAEARWKEPDEGTRSPLGRMTSGQDVGHAVAFLLSPQASHITGSCIDLSGGITLH